jgi:DNA invertase Pin-like site-specific DNA recombinase
MKLGIKSPNIYFEYESGIENDRVQFNRLMTVVQDGDTIAATEVSRLTRSTRQLCDIIDLAKERHLKLVIGTLVVDCTDALDPMTDGMLKMMGVFAEMERNMISQRVKSGMANAKAKGAKLGRPQRTVDTLPSSFIKHYPKYMAKQITLTDLARLCRVRSRQTIYNYIDIFNGVKKATTNK